VIDVTLPRLDGIEVARRARQALGGSSPSFLAMSGHSLDSHDAHGTSDWPFDAYFIKPVDLDALVGAVASSPKRSSERDR
jgi:DNA-binding response OmpR family regulator